MGFEKFTKGSSRGYEPRVSIRARGSIGFNQGAVNRYQLTEYRFAVLYYDIEEKLIGVKFTNDENEIGIMKVRINKTQTDAAISAKAFFDFHDINYKETRRCNAKWDDEFGGIIITIPNNNNEEEVVG